MMDTLHTGDPSDTEEVQRPIHECECVWTLESLFLVLK